MEVDARCLCLSLSVFVCTCVVRVCVHTRVCLRAGV